MSEPIFEAIQQFLRDAGVPFRSIHHEPTRTSEDAARIRGEELRTGGKALLLKVGDGFKLVVMSASLKLDSPATKRTFGVKKLRFATAEELRETTGLVPGSVPQFGHPILPFELFVDESIQKNDRIAFNAGSLTDSIIMAVDDYFAVATPSPIARFAKPTSDLDE